MSWGSGQPVVVRDGMTITAFDEDVDEDGKPDNLIASRTVERAPRWLNCKGSRWVLRIDNNGVRHESDLRFPAGSMSVIAWFRQSAASERSG
jgi:hypothetical protein